MFFYTIVYCDKLVIADELNTLRSFASMFYGKICYIFTCIKKIRETIKQSSISERFFY